MKNEFFYRSEDGVTQIHAVEWIPEVPAIGIIQILHGMAEYVERYDAFAEYMADQGFYVVGNDHLGHGQSVRSERYLGHLREYRGNKFVIRDIRTLQEGSIQKYPGLPYIMLGHSMGSFLLREYMTIYPESLSAAIIMGTGEQSVTTLKFAQFLCKFIAHFKGWKHKSKLMDKLTLGSYNKKFEDVTGVDWLSANAENCHRYDLDPLCGFSFTLGGYYQMFEGMKWILQDNHESRMQKELPVLLISGAEDPVGGFGKDVRAVFERYIKLGMKDVTIRLYEGDRHEILNEDNREQVYDDIVSWIYGKRENLTSEPLAVDTMAEKAKTKKHPAKASAPEAEEKVTAAKADEKPDTESETDTADAVAADGKAVAGKKSGKFSLSSIRSKAKEIINTPVAEFDDDDDIIKEDAVPEVTKNLSLRAASEMKELEAEYDDDAEDQASETEEETAQEPKNSGYMTLGDFIRSLSTESSPLREDDEEIPAEDEPQVEEEPQAEVPESAPEKKPEKKAADLYDLYGLEEPEEEETPAEVKAAPLSVLSSLGLADDVPEEEEEVKVPALEESDGFEEILFTIDDFDDAADADEYEEEDTEDYDDSDDDSEYFAEEDFDEEELDEEAFAEEDLDEEAFEEDEFEEEYPEIEDDFIDDVLEAIPDETDSDSAPEPTIDMKKR